MSEQDPKLKIDIDEETAKGTYTNLAFISHSETEFVLDFSFLQPNNPRAKVLQRLITSPLHAKRFVAAMADNIRKYEERFGEIPDRDVSEGRAADYYQ